MSRSDIFYLVVTLSALVALFVMNSLRDPKSDPAPISDEVKEDMARLGFSDEQEYAKEVERRALKSLVAPMEKIDGVSIHELKLWPPGFGRPTFDSSEAQSDSKEKVKPIRRVGEAKDQVREIPVEHIVTSSWKSRPEPSESRVLAQVELYKRNGFDHKYAVPILDMGDGTYILLESQFPAVRRRLEAMRTLGEKTIPARVSLWADFDEGHRDWLRKQYMKALEGY